MTIEELLSETVEEAQRRERVAFDDFAGANKHRIVLFGAGTVGRKVAAALAQQATPPLAFADNNPALHGMEVDGIAVLSPLAAAARWGNDAVFVVTIFQPSGEGMIARIESLRRLGCQKVISFLPLAWKLSTVLPHFGVDLPSRILKQTPALKEISGILTDPISKQVLHGQVYWRLRADFAGIGPPSPDQYFPQDLITPNQEESFVDGGAFDGDTLRAMPWIPRETWAIEPDPENLRNFKSPDFQKVKICQVALGREPGQIRFNAAGTMASACSEQGGIEVNVATLDQLLGAQTITFLKLDVEGEELAALEGGVNILLRDQPTVAVCVYHRASDIWEIPLFLKQTLPNHIFALRAHAHDGFELVVYAISPDRKVG